jgi:excinuclease ABC subunit B
MRHVIFVSATPGPYEFSKSRAVAEQIIRPTGLVEPIVEVRPVAGQTEDVIREIGSTIQQGDRALITTLTKKLAEELSEYLAERGIKTRYLHSDIDTLERTEIIRQLRLGKFDVLVGINLLREGLDIPEVGFIGILDADKEGFLRDERSLIERALSEIARRRELQLAYNQEHGIIPQTIKKPIREKETDIKDVKHVPKKEIPSLIIEMETQMKEAAENLDFERAIALRDTIKNLNKRMQEGMRLSDFE